jgi:DNA-binding protein
MKIIDVIKYLLIAGGSGITKAVDCINGLIKIAYLKMKKMMIKSIQMNTIIEAKGRSKVMSIYNQLRTKIRLNWIQL